MRPPNSMAPKATPKKNVTSDNTIIDGRRLCIICDETIGTEPRTFYNYHNGNFGRIGMAHKTCVQSQEESSERGKA